MKQIKKTNKNILFFDDEPYMSDALAQALDIFGWNVTQVSEIDDLFMQLKSPQFDIILLDIMAPIPEMENDYIKFTKKEIESMEGGINTGIVLAKRIWKLNEKIPILFLSARQQPESIIVFQEEGKNCDWIRKPELVTEIIETLNKLLQQKS